MKKKLIIFSLNPPPPPPCPLSRVRKWSSPCSTSRSDGNASRSDANSSLKSDTRGSVKSDERASLKSKASLKVDHEKSKERKISSPAALHVTPVTKDASHSVCFLLFLIILYI
jgi:hypothetical protein